MRVGTECMGEWIRDLCCNVISASLHFFPFYVSMVAKSLESLLISDMLLLLLRTLDSFFFLLLLALIGDRKAAGWSYKHNSTHKLWLFVCGNRVNGMISIVTWARCIRISRITLWLATSNVYVCACVQSFHSLGEFTLPLSLFLSIFH